MLILWGEANFSSSDVQSDSISSGKIKQCVREEIEKHQPELEQAAWYFQHIIVSFTHFWLTSPCSRVCRDSNYSIYIDPVIISEM